MSSGDSIWIVRPRMYIPPGSVIGDYATLGTIVDASSPPTKTPVLWFDAGADSHADWKLILPEHYSAATGLTIQKIAYATDGVDTDDIEFEIRILDLASLDDLTGDLGLDTQAEEAITDTPDSTAFAYQETGSVAIPEANFGSVVAGTEVILRVTRDVSFDTNVDRLGLIGVYVIET